MNKIPPALPEPPGRKNFLPAIFILAIALPLVSVLLFATQSTLTYPVLIIFILLYAGIFLLLLKEIAGARKNSKDLKLEKENFKTILSNIGEGLITTDKEGNVLYMNPSAERLTGWNWQEVKHQQLEKVFNVVNEETKKPVEHIVSRILKDGKAIAFENNTILHARDKHRMVISNNGSPLVDADGNISGAVLVFNDITERKRAEKEINDYKFALDQSSVVDVSDSRGFILYGNENFCKITGYSKEEIIGQSHRILNSGYHSKAFIKDLWDTITQGKVWRAEVRNKTKTGKYYWVDTTIVPFLDADGKPFRYIAIRTNITERKEAEEKIKKNEQQFRLLLDSTAQGIYGVDMDGNCTFVNAACLKMLGYKKEEELLGQHIHTLIHHTRPDGTPYPANECRMYKALSGQDVTHVSDECFWRSDGSSFPVEYWSHPIIYNEKVVGAVAAFFDITERSQAEQKLKASEEKYRSLVEQAADAVMVFDFRGKILSANTSSCLALGYDKETLLKLNLTDIIPEKYRGKLPIDLSELSVKKALMVEREFMRCDGSCFFTEVSAQLTADGNIQTFVRDITERKQAEEELEESREKYRGLSEAAYEAIFISEKGICIEQNQTAEKMFGYTSEEAIGRYGTEWIVPEDREMVMKNMLTGNEEPYEAMALRKDGTTFPCLIRGRMMYYKGRDVRVTSLNDITERKKAEEKITKFNERFEMIAATTQDAIWEWNFQPNELWANEAHQHLYGLTMADSVPTAEMWEQKIHPDDRKAVVIDFEQSMASDKNMWIAEYRFKKHDGDYINIYDRTYIIRNADGKPIRTMGSMIDITERKKAENALIEKEFILTEAQRIAHIGSWVFELSGKIFWTPETYRIYGVSPDNFIPDADSFINLIHPDDRAAMQDWINKCVAGKKPGELEFRTILPNGTIRFLSGRGELEYDARHKPLLMRGTVQDITEHKKAEEKIKESLDRYDILAKATHDAIWDWDIKNNTVMYNTGMKKMFGYTTNEILNAVDWWRNNIHPEDDNRVAVMMAELFQQKAEMIRMEYRYRCANGTYKYIYDRAFVIYDENGKPARMIGAMQDITWQKEEELRISKFIIDAQEREREQIGMELHDNVNQILSASLLYLGMAKNEKKSQKKIFETIDLTSGFIKDAIFETRRVSHQLAPASFENVSLKDAIESLVHNMNSQKTWQVDIQFGDCPETDIRNDMKINLYRILQEQLNNISKYAHADKVTISVFLIENYISLKIADNGIGFDPQTVKKGIGLENIKRRTEVFSGKLNIHSAPGRGCEVIVEIPLAGS
ncbi:MAG: PAS domain S-box protein [Sphingobacteriales bacterium]|nr:PAS domain S-box protein [Sphingobacteriales bacterium]